MPETHTYEYAILRFVPKVEREEFVNVGVIVYSKRFRFLAVRHQLDTTRLSAFAADADLTSLRRYLEVWEMICQGNPEGGLIATLDLPSRFRWLTASRSTMIQCSKVHPGRCSDPAAVLDALFQSYVL